MISAMSIAALAALTNDGTPVDAVKAPPASAANQTSNPSEPSHAPTSPTEPLPDQAVTTEPATALPTEPATALPTEPATALPTAGMSPMVFKLEYVKADQLKPALTTLFPDNQIRAEIINNMLVISGSDEDCAKVKAMMAKLDTPPKQVIFETEAIEVSRDEVRNIGIDWGTVTALPSVPATDGSAYNISLNIHNYPEYVVKVAGTIHHLIENKKGRLLASPRIAVLDGQTAQILIGDKLAVESTQISNGTTITSVTYVEVGIKLEVTPTIHDDGTITTHIKPEVSNKTDTTTAGNPNIRTRQAETTLRVKNGETIVLGGMIQKQQTKDMIKFPLLGDLPVIGQFFRSANKEETESELIILLTPKLIDI
ncbi:secretin N-terminal domain-containing protein [Sporomusa ovata]|uniref:secretin N-terminal domain-containing protein n=1 Tax=Sporomusa ovata TaxID=2378 RepID=UPI001378AA5E|nr:secretin N-terminal domain-containing protein [Sporomusa ovata]